MHSITKILLFFSKKIEFLFCRFVKSIYKLQASKIIKRGNKQLDLYKTKYGDYYWLNKNKYIDNLIIQDGLFEESSTAAVKKIIKKSDIVMDIGANIGYYSVIFSKQVGPKGKVYAFEPLTEYREVLEMNLSANRIKNCIIENNGLSDREQKLILYVNDSSATLHPLDENFQRKEKINSITLNSFVRDNKIDKLNFIKIDVDGHEPAVLNGAWETIRKFKTVVLLEISHLHYLKYGINVWDFYDILKNKGFFIYTEIDLKKINNKNEFLMNCCNFNHSTNIIISLNPIDQ